MKNTLPRSGDADLHFVGHTTTVWSDGDETPIWVFESTRYNLDLREKYQTWARANLMGRYHLSKDNLYLTEEMDLKTCRDHIVPAQSGWIDLLISGRHQDVPGDDWNRIELRPELAIRFYEHAHWVCDRTKGRVHAEVSSYTGDDYAWYFEDEDAAIHFRLKWS